MKRRELRFTHRDFSRRLFEKYRFITTGSRLTLYFLHRQYPHFYSHQTYNYIHQLMNTAVTHHIAVLFQVDAPLLRDFLFKGISREMSLLMNVNREANSTLNLHRQPVTHIFNHYHHPQLQLRRPGRLSEPPGKTTHIIPSRSQTTVKPEFMETSRIIFSAGPGLKGPDPLHYMPPPLNRKETERQAQVFRVKKVLTPGAYQGKPGEYNVAVSKHRMNTSRLSQNTKKGQNAEFGRIQDSPLQRVSGPR
jgi:hypothetical protein